VPEVQPQDWQSSNRKRAEVAAIAGFGYPLMRTVAATWTRKDSGAEHLEAIRAEGRHPIISLWHGRIFPAVIYFQRRDVVVIISENYDGEWIARITHKFGYRTARGSTSRGGPKALLQLVREIKATGVAFTLDGPRGPAEVAQLGAVWLSKATGNPLLPFHAEASSKWTLNSWDRTQIPKPFATLATVVGAPLYVPRDADDAALEEWRQRLQQSLADARRECDRLLSAASRDVT
jgi:lysophospholipid acyltransferase (LPLAT)-like uncharacterized protein